MRIVAACAIGLTLTACASPQREAEQAAQRQQASDCLERESIAIAPQPVDLETAALAVLARCDYPGVIERKWAAEFPTERDFIRQQTQKQYADIIDTTKRGIALLRTRGPPQKQTSEKALPSQQPPATR